MRRLAPKLVAELLRDDHRDRATLETGNRSVVVAIDKVLVGNRTKLLGAPRDGSPIDESARLLVRLEDDEELAHDPNPLALVVLHLPGREIAELANRLALELVDVLHVVHPVIMGRLVVRLVVDIHRIVLGTTLAPPGVGTRHAVATIRCVTVHAKRRRQPTRTLAAIAVAHLAADRHEDLIVGQIRRHLDDHRTDLEATGRGVSMRHHLRNLRLDVEVRIMDLGPSRLLTTENRRRIGQDASRSVVGVADTDATATIGDPEASLRDGGVGTIVSGERHFCFKV